jgi:hypothetical protein
MFFIGRFDVVSSHSFTTNSPRITVQKTTFFNQNLQNPQQKGTSPRLEKNQKEDPETVLRSRGHRSADGP